MSSSLSAFLIGILFECPRSLRGTNKIPGTLNRCSHYSAHTFAVINVSSHMDIIMDNGRNNRMTPPRRISFISFGRR